MKWRECQRKGVLAKEEWSNHIRTQIHAWNSYSSDAIAEVQGLFTFRSRRLTIRSYLFWYILVVRLIPVSCRGYVFRYARPRLSREVLHIMKFHHFAVRNRFPLNPTHPAFCYFLLVLCFPQIEKLAFAFAFLLVRRNVCLFGKCPCQFVCFKLGHISEINTNANVQSGGSISQYCLVKTNQSDMNLNLDRNSQIQLFKIDSNLAGFKDLIWTWNELYCTSKVHQVNTKCIPNDFVQFWPIQVKGSWSLIL